MNQNFSSHRLNESRLLKFGLGGGPFATPGERGKEMLNTQTDSTESMHSVLEKQFDKLDPDALRSALALLKEKQVHTSTKETKELQTQLETSDKKVQTLQTITETEVEDTT